MKPLRLAVLTSLLVASLALATVAADDPPSRVARLNYLAGSVSVQPRSVEDWVAAAINRPLTTADRVWTDKDSRTELQLGTAALRLNSETSLTLTNVSDNAVQLELDQGVLNLRVLELYPGEIYEVDTPNLAFTILKRGSYRFDVDPDGDTTAVTVWKGEGEATGDGPAQRVRSGARARFSSGRSLQHYFGEAPPRDGFDDWCRVRDERTDHVVSARYVSRGVVGYEDLDEYGRWSRLEPYGYVWSPYQVVGGWAPYRYGRWVWLEPWGWTWVDDAPWGFAPFHYGRWIYHRSGWFWAPGPVFVRPVWAPALVAWFGGPRWGLSFGFGSGVGWFPLGFGEPFLPFYHHSRGYFRNVNFANSRFSNITYITNNYYNNRNLSGLRYIYRDRPNAVTAVGSDALIHSRPVQANAFALRAEHLRGAPLLADNSLSPTRQSILGGNAGGRIVAPPSRALNPQVVSRMQPPARPAPFRGRDEASPTAPGRAPDVRAERAPREAAPGGPAAGRSEPVGPRSPQTDANARANGVPGAETHRVPRPPERGVGSPEAPAGMSGRVVHRPPAAGNVAEVEARPGEVSQPDVRTRDMSPRFQPGERTAQQSHAVPRPPAQPREASPATEARGPERQPAPNREVTTRPPETSPRGEGGGRVPRPRTNAPAPQQRERPAPEQHAPEARSPQASMDRAVPRPAQAWLAQQRSQPAQSAYEPSRFASEPARTTPYAAPQSQFMRTAPAWRSGVQSYRSAPGVARAPAPSYSGGRASAPSSSNRGGGGSGNAGRGGRSH